MALGEPRQLTELCELIRQGADGFLPYSDVSKHLLSAIRTLAEGGLWIRSEVLAHYIALSRSAVALPPVEHKLTARETEVVGLAAQHLSNKEISARLGISEGVVKYHMSNACRKLGVSNRHAAAERAKGKLGLRFETAKV